MTPGTFYRDVHNHSSPPYITLHVPLQFLTKYCQIPTHTVRYCQIPSDTIRYQHIPSATNIYHQIPTHTFRHCQIPAHTLSDTITYHHIPSHTNRYHQIPAYTIRYQKISSDTNTFPSDTITYCQIPSDTIFVLKIMLLLNQKKSPPRAGPPNSFCGRQTPSSPIGSNGSPQIFQDRPPSTLALTAELTGWAVVPKGKQV